MLLDDQFAFALIQDSDTVGMFQLESPGQQDLVGRLQPRDPQDVIADISLFGPGPNREKCPRESRALAVSPANLSHYKRAGPHCARDRDQGSESRFPVAFM
ncbi:hypothetical protein OG894_38115 [Streptomyces sp. NBC_01724]|nr:hypothetical protein [Streptomyces sp. NBC_01724]WTE49858.1 hypothetical protein OG987_03635 [Streptomyces sp. NBC_01620]WTE57944.1 hypothetical protein OG784_03755 [Streptomyces sp. NBC_01617]